MRSLVFVYCIFCLLPLPVASAAAVLDEGFVVAVVDDLVVVLSVLPLLASDDFLVSELRVDVDILLAYLFTRLVLLFLLIYYLCVSLSVSYVCSMNVVYALLPAERIHNMIFVLVFYFFNFPYCFLLRFFSYKFYETKFCSCFFLVLKKVSIARN